MDMGLSAEQSAIRDSIRKFLSVKSPVALAMKVMQSASGYSRDVWTQIGALGWLGMAIPEKYGGAGLGLEELAIMYEEFGRALYQGPHFGSGILCAQLLAKLGNEAQKQQLLPCIASGEKVLALAFPEADGQWRESSIKLQARNTGNGWSLNGTKLFVTHAMVADELLCAARDADTHGVSLFRIRNPKALEIIAMPSALGNLFYEVSFRDFVLSREEIVGAPGKAWPALQEVIDWGAAVQCAEMVGLSQTILDMSVDYAKTRVQFGHPIGSYQAIQHVLAEMLTRLDAARLLTYQAVSLLHEGLPAQKELAMAKAYVNEGAYQITLDGMQVHGGVGYMLEHPLPYYVQRMLYGKMHLGDTDVYLERVAEALGM